MLEGNGVVELQDLIYQYWFVGVGTFESVKCIRWLTIGRLFNSMCISWKQCTYSSLNITSFMAPFSGVFVTTIFVSLIRLGSPPKYSPPDSGALIATLVRNFWLVWYASSILSSTSFLLLDIMTAWNFPSLNVPLVWRTISPWPPFMRTSTCPSITATE